MQTGGIGNWEIIGNDDYHKNGNDGKDANLRTMLEVHVTSELCTIIQRNNNVEDENESAHELWTNKV